MAELVKTLELHIHPDDMAVGLFQELTAAYSDACDKISDYVFHNGFILNFMDLQKQIYGTIRETTPLKSQMVISALKTVTARYKTVKEQMYQNPYKYKDETDSWRYITRTLEWLQTPVRFRRPQADLVRNRDYSFVNGGSLLSINTLGKRVKVPFDIPECFQSYFMGGSGWSFGTAKLLSLNGNWYLHIPMTRKAPKSEADTSPSHVVGIDRGLRFIATAYDEKGNTSFVSGEAILKKRGQFNQVRAELQSKGTKSAKRALKRISGRENRWMSDVNHQISKALVGKYGSNTLFVLEDLIGVSFSDNNLKNRSSQEKNELRSWAFYQLEQYLTYKAQEVGSTVIKVPANYTSQRCPKCGRIHKENRDHKNHEYICDACGYRSNDDRIGAMNLYTLGTMYVSGDVNPRFGPRKVN